MHSAATNGIYDNATGQKKTPRNMDDTEAYNRLDSQPGHTHALSSNARREKKVMMLM